MNHSQSELVDGIGRIARKLRTSITDRCNMRRVYCMPANNTEWFEQNDILTSDEIVRPIPKFGFFLRCVLVCICRIPHIYRIAIHPRY